MNFSQEEVIESSQSGESKRDRRGRPRKSDGTQKALPKRRSQRKQADQQPLPTDSADWSSSVLLEIPQTDTEESSAGNLSGSIFTGQQDLLRQYQNHEQDLRQRDALLEQVLEQSRKACEQLKLQSSFSQGGSQIGGGQQAFHSQEPPQAKQVAISKEASCQTVFNLQDAEVQCSQPKITFCHASVQLSPISQKRSSQNVATQSSPTVQPKRPRISTSTNTDYLQRENASAQTNHIETCDVAIQKYHSTRVTEMASQTDDVVVAPPKPIQRAVSRRNVSTQHRARGTLDLDTANSVGLGIALHCDPARLHRALIKMAAEQHNQSRGGSSSEVDSSGSMQDGGGLELFGQDDPYYANYAYFMDDEGGEIDGGSTRGSELLEQEMSCFVEDDYIG